MDHLLIYDLTGPFDGSDFIFIESIGGGVLQAVFWKLIATFC